MERSLGAFGSSVDSRTISAALWFTSFGSLLERLMQQVWHDSGQRQEPRSVKMSHYRALTLGVLEAREQAR